MKLQFVVSVFCVAIAAGAGAQTYSNGPLITGMGDGFGGANTSGLAANLSVFGYGAQLTAALNNRIADEFTVPCGENWFITEIRAFAFQQQTTASTTSTLTAANYRIWNGIPNDPASTILHDFSAASQMTSTDFSLNTYRVDLIGNLLLNTQPIFTARMMGNSIQLPAGTYWLDVQLAGSLTNGPFIPPISTTAGGTTGNAIQFLSNGGNPAAWGTAPLASGATAAYAQGIPFEIDYVIIAGACFDLNITQAAPGSPITLADTGGTPGNTALNVISLSQGTFPNGWLFGLDIPLAGFAAQIQAGPPFNVTLDALGGYSIGPIGAPPIPIPIWYIGLELSGATLVSVTAAKTTTLQ